jgi:hypothetical protein
MDGAGLLSDGFGRIHDGVHRAVTGLDVDLLSLCVEAEANPIAWLVWHLTRVQDDHIADAFGVDQVWLTGGWAKRFDLPFEDTATGYGQSADEVAAVRVPGELLLRYHDEVHTQTLARLERVNDADLDRIVDAAWDPPVTLAVRLVSVISDGLQHVGQAAFVRGILQRR